MDASTDAAPLASFEAKWAAAYPELDLALRFVPARERDAQAAFACLRRELEHAAFGIREEQPAALKLQWWAEEFARAGNGEARHPLTQALRGHPGFGAIALADWHAVVIVALAQRDPELPADHAALIEAALAFQRPLAAIETRLFAGADADATARVHALSRALRETATLGIALQDGRLPLPLDVLARHRLARGGLATASPAQVAALQEWLGMLASDCAALAASNTPLGALAAASLRAERWRAWAAARSGDPLAVLNASFGRVPFGAAWAAWRAARRSPR